jgi:PAS domain S-box-containing protein
MTKKQTKKVESLLTDEEKPGDMALLAQASIEKAGEAIFWIDKNANFVNANEAGCKHLGYTKDELLSLTVFDIDPNFPRQRWADHWEGLKKKGTLSLETLHRHKSGKIFPAEVRLNFIRLGDKEYNFAFASDISNRNKIESTIFDLAKGIYSAVGENFFVSVVNYLARALRADYAYVAEITSENPVRARTLALLADGVIIDNLEVDLSGTPCETVSGNEVCSYPFGVQERFPRAHMMAKLDVQAYFGATLDDSQGENLGLLTVMYRHPVDRTEMIESMLKIFAARTSAELERKKFESKLKESEARYRDITENSAFGIIVYNESGQCMVANRAVAEMIGATVEQVLSQNFFTIESWRRSGLLDTAIRVIETREKKKESFYISTSFGKDVWLDFVFVPYIEKEEKYLMLLAEDITERKLAEQALLKAHNELEQRVRERTAELLRANEELQVEIVNHRNTEKNLAENEKKFRRLSHEFNTLLNAIPDRLVLLSPDLKILWSNKAFDAEIIARSDKDYEQNCYRVCCNQSAPCVNCPVLKSIHSGREESARVEEPDGRVFDKRAFPIMDESGQVSRIIELSRDISARIRMEEEAKLVQSRLIHTNKMTSLGTLVSGVAHEINNPNSYIMSNAEMFTQIWKDAAEILQRQSSKENDLLLGGVPFEELVHLAPALLDGITEGSVRIKNIIQSLTNFGKPDRFALDGEIDIEKTIKSARVMLDKHIKKLTDRFRVDCEKNMPLVKGSSQQIEQVIINLIMNALQAMPDGESGIRISGFFDEEEDRVVVMVKDEGIGIPENIMQNITDPFFTTRSNDGGTGLGLSISYAIIKDHNGELLFESKKGEGTTATVKLPVKKMK